MSYGTTQMRTRSLKSKRSFIIIGSAATLIGGLLGYLSLNTEFDLILPDNLELYNVTLSQDNFTRLKHNVGIFTVYSPHQTAGGVTSGYCQIAEIIHENEDGYDGTPVGNATIFNATAPPKWCDPELNPLPVAEFPFYALTLVVGLSGAIFCTLFLRT